MWTKFRHLAIHSPLQLTTRMLHHPYLSHPARSASHSTESHPVFSTLHHWLIDYLLFTIVLLKALEIILGKESKSLCSLTSLQAIWSGCNFRTSTIHCSCFHNDAHFQDGTRQFWDAKASFPSSILGLPGSSPLRHPRLHLKSHLEEQGRVIKWGNNMDTLLNDHHDLQLWWAGCIMPISQGLLGCNNWLPAVNEKL